MTSSVSEYKTSAVMGGGVKNSFKTADGETHVGTHYRHTQGTPATTNAIGNLIPQFMSSVLNLVFLI